MNKLELYYEKNKDSIQVVKNGKIIYMERGIHDSTFLATFDDWCENGMETYKDLKVVSPGCLEDAINHMLEHIESQSHEEELWSDIVEFLEDMKSPVVEGELFYSEEY